MGVAWLLSRAELRRRLASLAGLAGIVAVVTAVVLAGAAGARRTTSVLDRFRDETRARDLSAIVLSPDLTADLALTERLRDEVAEVEGVTGVSRAFGYFVNVGVDVDFILVSSPDGYYDTIDRAIAVDGRMPDSDAVDEVALNETAAEALGLGVGDRLTAETFAPDTIVDLFNGEGFPDGPDGPTFGLDVVGVVRTGEELSATADVANAAGITSPAFAAEVEGEAGRSVLLLGAHAAPGTDIDAVQRVLSEQVGEKWEAVAVPVGDDYVGEVSRAHRTLAVGIAVFSGVAALAGFLAVGQALSRQNLLRAPDDGVARGLGATRRMRTVAVVLPSATAMAAGVAAGVVGAIALSPLFPLSIARRAEVDPGLRVDVPVLVLGGGVVLAGCSLWTWLSARSVVRRSGASSSPRTSRSAAPIGRWGASLPMTVGLGMVLERGRGRTAVPARSAVVGAAVAVTGVVGVAVFLATTDDAQSDPGRYGWAWSSSPEVLSQDSAATAAVMASDEEIEATAELLGGTVEVGEETIYAYALDVQKGSMGFTVLEGDLPTGRNEVALGRRTMDDLDLALGDRVEASAPAGAASELTVVGVVVPPLLDSTDPGRGAVLSVDGLNAIRPETFSNYLVLSYVDGVDRVALEERLTSDYGLGFVASQGTPPGQLQQLDGMRSVLVALVVFLVAIGVIGLLHFLAVSVRRRRDQFAVLRSIGFVRGQVRRSVSWQAVTATAFGVAVGLPAGVILGRAAWLLAVRDIGMDDTPSTPWLAIAIVAAVALAGAAVLALAPGRYASRGEPAEMLRAE